MTVIYNNAGLGSSGTQTGLSIRDLVTGLSAGSSGQVRVTFLAGSGGTWTTSHCSIGVCTATDGSTSATAATPVELTFAGGHGFTISASATITSDWVNLSFTSSNVLVVVMDCDATNAQVSTSSTTIFPGQYTLTGTSYNLANPTTTNSANNQQGVQIVETQAAAGAGPVAKIYDISQAIKRASYW